MKEKVASHSTLTEKVKESFKDQIGPEKLPVAAIEPGTDFTGVARSIRCYLNQQQSRHFTDFKILTLHIEKGKVVKCEVSDPYGHFEVGAKLGIANDLGIFHLNAHWSDGKTLEK